MSALLVLVAHNGKTLQLEVHPTTRVDAVQQALVSFTRIPVSDQIVMCQGVRLDANRPLSAYKLPVADPTQAEDHPVFLYNKSYLRPGNPGPSPEVQPSLQVAVPAPLPVPARHPLQSASSPLVRALPDYERQFQHHLLVGQAYWEVGQKRIQRSRQLLSEQEVQARAADAARANVEAHYTYILTSYQDFLDRYSAQHQAHTQLLASTHDALALMSGVELHAAVQTERWRRLIDLVPQQKLRDWHDTCRRSHEHFAAKVSELETLFNTLKADVEGLFLQAPSVDLDHLGQRLAEMDRRTDEGSSIVQGLSADLRKVQALVEDTVRQLGANALSSSSVHDACGAMETINETHVQQLLPRLTDCDRALEAFNVTCSDAKTRMTRDVVEQLQRISAQQSKIRDMKNKLAAFVEVLQRQQDAFAELRHVHKLPAAYRYALSECLRRKAWGEVFAGQAGKLAEHMAKLREKEAVKREGFQRQVERILPLELLTRMGLLKEPPHCQISVPASDPQLLVVTPQDVQRIPTDRTAHAAFLGGEGAGAAASASQEGSSSTGKVDDAQEGEAVEPQAPNLEMENARLRADLATQVALNCLNELRAQPQETERTSAAKSKAGKDGEQSAAEADAGAPSAPATPVKRPARSEAEALALLQRALQSKDAYAAKLEQSNAAVTSSLAKYERRIAQLEALVQTYSQQLETSQQSSQSTASRVASGPLQANTGTTEPETPRQPLRSAMAESAILLVNIPAGQPAPPSSSPATATSAATPPTTTVDQSLATSPESAAAGREQAAPIPPEQQQQQAIDMQPPPREALVPAGQLLGYSPPPGAYSTLLEAGLQQQLSQSAIVEPQPSSVQHSLEMHREVPSHPHPQTWAPSRTPHAEHSQGDAAAAAGQHQHMDVPNSTTTSSAPITAPTLATTDTAAVDVAAGPGRSAGADDGSIVAVSGGATAADVGREREPLLPLDKDATQQSDSAQTDGQPSLESASCSAVLEGASADPHGAAPAADMPGSTPQEEDVGLATTADVPGSTPQEEEVAGQATTCDTAADLDNTRAVEEVIMAPEVEHVVTDSAAVDAVSREAATGPLHQPDAAAPGGGVTDNTDSSRIAKVPEVASAPTASDDGASHSDLPAVAATTTTPTTDQAQDMTGGLAAEAPEPGTEAVAQDMTETITVHSATAPQEPDAFFQEQHNTAGLPPYAATALQESAAVVDADIGGIPAASAIPPVEPGPGVDAQTPPPNLLAGAASMQPESGPAADSVASLQEPGTAPAPDTSTDALQEAAEAVVAAVDTAAEALESAAQSVLNFLAGSPAAPAGQAGEADRETTDAAAPAAFESASPDGGSAGVADLPPGADAANAEDATTVPDAARAGHASIGFEDGMAPAATAGEDEDAYIPDIDELEVPEGSSNNGDGGGGGSGPGAYASRLLSSLLSRSLFGSAMLDMPQHPHEG